MSRKTSFNLYHDNFVELPWHSIANQLISIHRLVMLVGEPGTGKTTWSIKLAQSMTDHSPEIIQGTPDTEINHIFGFFALVGGETKFCDGPLPRALKNGYYLLVEEFNLIPLETRACLLTLRGRSNITNPFTGEVITIPQKFHLIATSNPESVKCHRNVRIAQALLDDFMVLEVPNLNSDQVKSMLRANYRQASNDLIDKVTDLWQKYHEIDKVDSTEEEKKGHIRLSYRAADHLIKLLLSEMKEDVAIQIALINKYIIDEDIYAIAKMQSSLAI